MVSKVFEHPFDLTKVRLQAQVLDSSARFNGPLDCLYKTWKYEGFRGLYRVSITPRTKLAVLCRIPAHMNVSCFLLWFRDYLRLW
jgi:hypothetical protein